MITSLDKNSSVLVATFSPWKNGQRSPTNGMVEPFINFFSNHVNNFALIDQPHPGSDKLLPFVEIYKNGKYKAIKKSSLLVSWLYPFLFPLQKRQFHSQEVFLSLESLVK